MNIGEVTDLLQSVALIFLIAAIVYNTRTLRTHLRMIVSHNDTLKIQHDMIQLLKKEIDHISGRVAK